MSALNNSAILSQSVLSWVNSILVEKALRQVYAIDASSLGSRMIESIIFPVASSRYNCFTIDSRYSAFVFSTNSNKASLNTSELPVARFDAL